MRRDPLRILEAAYAFGVDEATWLARLLDALEPYDRGEGIAAYVSELEGVPRQRTVDSRTTLDGVESLLLLPPPMYRALHAPLPLTSHEMVFPRVAKAFGFPYQDGDATLEQTVVPRGAFAICGGDTRETLLVTFHHDGRGRFTERDRATLDAVSAHLGSALRLRGFARASDGADSPDVDAVLSPDGRVLDARGDARTEEARGSLLDAVMRSERAKLRAATPEERLEVWTSLVDGRWSILENVERDGKRLLLARKNAPTVARLRRLSERERAVTTYAAYGHAYKLIAYELGLPLSTVAATLDTSLRKLGISSREELVRMFAREELPLGDADGD